MSEADTLSSPAPSAAPAAPALSGAWRRWQASTLQPSAPPGPETAQSTAPSPSAQPEEVDPRIVFNQWKQQAEQEGHAAGLRRGLEEGRQQGHAAGYAAGLAEAQAQLQAQLGDEKVRLADLLRHSAQAIEQLHAELGQATIALALDIARDLVRTQLAVRPETLLPLVGEVLRADTGSGPLRMWLNPDDLDLVQLRLGTELADSACRLIPDATLARGGCRVQSAYGDVDATLQARWQQASGALGHLSDWETP
ncbi:MAG: flagellar assembly protein FliH [Comamonas sp.]